MTEAIVIIALLAGVLIVRLIAGRFDHARIAQEIGRQGGDLRSCQWHLFGPGWLGDKNRIYHLRYLDREGNEHEAFCKTGMWSGVYFTEDWIVTRAAPHDTQPTAVAEPARIVVQLDHVNLAVRDLDACSAFYREVLGFDVLQKWDEARAVLIGANGTLLCLTEGPVERSGTVPAPHIVLACRPVDFTHVVERVRRSNAPIDAGPCTHGHGEMIQFRDPAGTVVEVRYPGLARTRA